MRFFAALSLAVLGPISVFASTIPLGTRSTSPRIVEREEIDVCLNFISVTLCVSLFPSQADACNQCLSGSLSARRRSLDPSSITCPVTHTSCLVSGRGAFECIDTNTDVESCGGCASTDEGLDCTAIENAENVACVNGRCIVRGCEPGWTVGEDSLGCVEDIHGGEGDRRQILMSSLRGAAKYWDI